MKNSWRNILNPRKVKEPGGKPKHSKYALKTRPSLTQVQAQEGSQ